MSKTFRPDVHPFRVPDDAAFRRSLERSRERRKRAQDRRTLRRWVAAAALVSAGIVGAGIAEGSYRGEQYPALTPKVVSCVVHVWEDGSAAFRDAEAVMADPSCKRAILRRAR